MYQNEYNGGLQHHIIAINRIESEANFQVKTSTQHIYINEMKTLKVHQISEPLTTKSENLQSLDRCILAKFKHRYRELQRAISSSTCRRVTECFHGSKLIIEQINLFTLTNSKKGHHRICKRTGEITRNEKMTLCKHDDLDTNARTRRGTNT